MKTRITELFGVKYPILNAGMGRVALPNMVAAVSNAGGLGVYGAGSSPPDVTRAGIREIRKLTDKPFGVNCPLALPNAMENAKVCLDEGVPLINYSMGKGDWIAKAAHAYGGKVIASINSINLAQRAQAQGADAVIAAGHEAAGHAGEITTFTLIPRLAEVIQIPIVAAGGVANGAQILAALTLGASGVSMGTRFWTTQEGPMHQAWKEKAVELDVDGTLFSTKFDGIPMRAMRTPVAEKIFHSKMLNIWDVFVHSFSIAKELNIPWPKLLIQTLSLGPKQIEVMMRMAQNLKFHGYTFTSSDMNLGMTASGQSVGLVHDIPSVEELFQRLVAEIQTAKLAIDTSLE